MRSLCLTPAFRAEIRNYADRVRLFAADVTAVDQPELFQNLLNGLLALNAWLDAHEQRCRVCRRRGGRS